MKTNALPLMLILLAFGCEKVSHNEKVTFHYVTKAKENSSPVEKDNRLEPWEEEAIKVGRQLQIDEVWKVIDTLDKVLVIRCSHSDCGKKSYLEDWINISETVLQCPHCTKTGWKSPSVVPCDPLRPEKSILTDRQWILVR